MEIKITVTEEELKKFPNDYELGFYVRKKFRIYEGPNPIYVEGEYDLCVICGEKTDYKYSQSIHERFGYIEGVGQLCRKDYLNIKNNE
jgi:hypothetical protein